MAKNIRTKDLPFIEDYEPPYGVWIGISNKTVDNPKITMSHVIIPPGARNQRHYHVNCNAVIFTIKGRRRMFFGPDHEMQQIDVEPGDFTFVPQGEIHGSMNLSDTEPVEMVACYVGVSSTQEAKTIFVEPRRK